PLQIRSFRGVIHAVYVHVRQISMSEWKYGTDVILSHLTQASAVGLEVRCVWTNHSPSHGPREAKPCVRIPRPNRWFVDLPERAGSISSHSPLQAQISFG